MRLEILQVPDCPNAAVLAARLAELAGTCPDLTVMQEIATTDRDPGRLGMTGSPTRRTVVSVRVLSPDRLPIRRASSRLCMISRSRPPNSGPSAISAAVGIAPAPVASPSKSAPATHAMTTTATASTRTSCRIS